MSAVHFDQLIVNAVNVSRVVTSGASF